MSNEAKDYPVVGVTSGMSGHFAVLYCWNPDGFAEPWNTGVGRYATKEEAEEEARGWAEAEGVNLCPSIKPR